MAATVEKIAVVTGSNKGLGFSVVKGLCQKYDGRVYLTARDETRGREAVEKLNKLGLKPLFHQLDISDSASVKKFADYIKTKHGGFVVLVNNAAIMEWDEIYPSYEDAKKTIDINYKSLLTIEKYLFPLLRDGARVVNVSSACGHLSNLKNAKWIDMFKNPDLTVHEINNFVDEYLESVKNGTFDKNNFADEGKHAEYRVSKVALSALARVWQREYNDRNFSINTVHPGFLKTDMANGGGEIDADEAAVSILYLVLDASPKLRGVFMWYNMEIVVWDDTDKDYARTGLW